MWLVASRSSAPAPTATRRPRRSTPRPAQGDSHAGFAFVAHRAVVDVDVELGLARVVELTCAQDVGKAVNPMALEGQLEGGSIQGLGLALSEELLLDDDGLVQTRSFGSYRIPTIVDAAPVPVDRARARRSRHPVRAARRGGDAVDLLDARDPRRAARGDGPRADAGAGAS